MRQPKLKILFTTLLVLAMTAPSWGADIPTLHLGYIFTTHHTPFLVAASKGEDFRTMGVYLKPIIPRDRYQLVADGKPIANLRLIVAKSGSETAALFARNQLDIAMASVTAIMAGIDKGTPMKILSPLQTEGMALVAPKGSPLSGWDSFVAQVKNAKQPVKIGYHSPTSAPKIVLEGALKKAGLTVTEDPNNRSAQVLLADLKGTANLTPALSSGQVDMVVGPSPFPEVAVSRGVGKIVLQLRDLPPAGYWYDFPCCVTAATEKTIAQHPAVVGKFVELIARTNLWANQNQLEAGTLSAAWIGLPPETAKISALVYLPKFTDRWMRGAGDYMTILNAMGNFKGQLKGKQLEAVEGILFDKRFINQVKM